MASPSAQRYTGWHLEVRQESVTQGEAQEDRYGWAPITSLTKRLLDSFKCGFWREEARTQSPKGIENTLASLLRGIKVYALNLKWKKNTLQEPRKEILPPSQT